MKESSPLTRRNFVAGNVGLGCGLLAGSSVAGAEKAAEFSQRCLDYGRSFIGHTGSHNSVRFWVESRTIIHDDAESKSHEFFQCGSCKSENTFVAKDLFKEPNYDFLPIIGRDSVVLFRRHATAVEPYRDVRAKVGVWGTPIFQLKAAEDATLLDTPEKICRATALGLPIVVQTEIREETTNLRAVIEYPVKTLNTNPEKGLWQVDTGPVAFPDLSKRVDPLVESLRLAFVACNAADFTDFIIEQPTSAVVDGREVCQVYHYSKPFCRPAKNTLFGLGKLG